MNKTIEYVHTEYMPQSALWSQRAQTKPLDYGGIQEAVSVSVETFREEGANRQEGRR